MSPRKRSHILPATRRNRKGVLPRLLGGLGVLTLLILSNQIVWGAGVSAAESLLAGAGARPMALGGAYTALANDPFAMAYNPAGLARMRGRPKLGLMHTEWLGDTQQQYLALGIPSKPGTFGFDLYRMDLGKFTGRDTAGRPTEEFSAGDISFGVSWAQPVHRNFLIGSKISYFQEELAGYKASTFFGDFGMMMRANKSLILGAAIRNVGPGLKFIEETSPLPRHYALGASYFLGGVRLTGDYKMYEEDRESEFAGGIELSPIVGNSRPVALRLGQADFSGNGFGIGAGVGLNWNGMGFDYAFKPFGILGGTHRVSVTLGF